MWWRITKALAGFTASAYVKDVVVRPQRIAQLARAYAVRVRKPLLNIGAGTPNSSLRVVLFGPTLWGDVNIDIAAPRNVRHGPNEVSWGDAHDLSEWPDQYFGAVIASHVLEHLERPDIALREWHRVAEKVFTVVPPWWAPHTWTHPGHLWFIDPDLKVAKPLYVQRMRNLPLPSKGVVRSDPWGKERLDPSAARLDPSAVEPRQVLLSSKSDQVLKEFQYTNVQPMRQERARPQQSVAPVNVRGNIARAKRSLR